MDDFFAYSFSSTVNNTTSATNQSNTEIRDYELRNTKIKRIQLDALTNGNVDWASGSFSIKIEIINQSNTVIVLDTTNVTLSKAVPYQTLVTLLDNYLGKNIILRITLISYAGTNFSFNPVSATTTATVYMQIEKDITQG